MNASPRRVLIADDDASIRLVLSQAFTRAGYQVRATGSAATLLKWAADGDGDLVVTDVIMPDENAFDMLPRLRKVRPQLPAIVMSAQNTLLTAVNAAQIGAYAYIPKPFDLDEMLATAQHALARPAEAAKVRAQAKAIRDEALPLIGRSAPMQEVYRTLARLVNTSLTVLITGESGAGKDLAARAVHDLGRRRDGPFVPVRLAGASLDRLEAELFGAPDRPGRLAEADGGTLFLDEVGDLSPEAQARLLGVLDGSDLPTGARGRPVDVRIVAATRRNLREMVQDGRFSEALFFRLNVAPLRLPPLRDRVDDIGDLARAFLLRAQREGLPAKAIDEGAIERLKRHGWPGNVRELENLMRRISALHPEDPITAAVVQRELQTEAVAAASPDRPASLETSVEPVLSAVFAAAPGGMPGPGLYDRVLMEIERPLIRMTLAATRGNQLRAAEILGLNRNTLRKKIRDCGLSAKTPSGQ